MRKKIIALMVAMAFVFTACTSQKKMESDDDFSVDAENSSGATSDTSLDSSSDDLGLDVESSPTPAKKDEASAATDDFDLDSPAPTKDAAPKADQAQASGDSDLALENELNSLDGNTPKANQQNNASAQAPADELSLDEPAPQAQTPPPANTSTDVAVTDPNTPPEINLDDPAPQSQTPPPADQTQIAANATTNPPATDTTTALTPPPLVDAQTPPSTVSGEPVTISSVQYKANSNGGTISIGADKPLSFTTRMNPTTNQFVVEVQNSVIPKKLKRSLNTKDMASSIGSVDIYQKEGSNVSRFVVQLRPGSGDPVVQQEGNSLLIIGPGNGAVAAAPVETKAPEAPVNTAETTPSPTEEVLPVDTATNAAGETVGAEAPKSVTLATGKVAKEVEETPVEVPTKSTGLLSYDSLDQFLMSNTKFYGKKISIETSGMDVTDALKFLSEESGVNIMLDDSVTNAGKVNIKLKDVPWDQAFVLILKSKKLVYKRQGNVIRVATYQDIKKDEDEAIAMKDARKVPEPLAVKRYFIAYAELSDIKEKIDDYLKAINTAANQGKTGTEIQVALGKVIVDKRNNSLIITDTESNLKKIDDIVAALDTQPKQILIEGKVVEANEDFSQSLGVKWKSTATPASLNQPTNGSFGTDFSTKIGEQASFGVNWGQLDFLGSLSATISLGEVQNKVKVLSSPRITVLSATSAVIQSQVDIQLPGGTVTSNGTTTSNLITKQVGTTLQVTPTATNQGTVNLKLNLTRSIPQGVGAASRSAQTELFVRSGTTAVVGGVYNSSVNDSDSGIPVLRHVPILGKLFEAKSNSRAKDELIIFVTPTILKPL